MEPPLFLFHSIPTTKSRTEANHLQNTTGNNATLKTSQDGDKEPEVGGIFIMDMNDTDEPLAPDI